MEIVVNHRVYETRTSDVPTATATAILSMPIGILILANDPTPVDCPSYTVLTMMMCRHEQ